MVMGDDEDDSEDGGDGWWWSKQHGAAGSKSLLSPLLFTDCPQYQIQQKMLLHVILLFNSYIPAPVHSFLFPTHPSSSIKF